MQSTLRSIIGLLAIGGAATMVAAAPTYIGTEKCKPCHQPEHASWLKEKHSRALDSAKAGEFTAACLKCHATNSDEKLPGVECEACHGPGSEYAPMAVMIDKSRAVAKGLVMPGQAMCDGCHDGKDHHTKVAFGAFHHTHREKHEAQDID